MKGSRFGDLIEKIKTMYMGLVGVKSPFLPSCRTVYAHSVGYYI